MSYISKLRKTVGYVGARPACRNCKSYQAPVVYLTKNSNPAKSQPLCKKHGFSITPNGICSKHS